MTPKKLSAGESSSLVSEPLNDHEDILTTNVRLEDILATDELVRRPSRVPDYRAENEALSALAQVIGSTPEAIFDKLADAALRLCGAQSAGVSLLEKNEGSTVFRWRATAGAFAHLSGQILPRDFSPCGVVIDHDSIQLMLSPVRYYPYISGLAAPVHELLLVPFHCRGMPIGTLWVATHDESKKFDAEDARIATSLSQFASLAWQTMQARIDIETTQRMLHASELEQADRDKFLVALDDATRPLIDAREITQTSARLLGEHLGVNRCAYADVEADENTFNLTGDYNRDVPSIVGRYRFDQFGDECLRLMRRGDPYVVEDAQSDPRTGNVRGSYEATLIRSVICVSLRKAGQFVAAMAVHQTTPRVWQPAEVELVQLVANRCWESIERTRVMRVLAASEQQLRLAVETGRLGVWQLDLQTEELSCSAQCKANYGLSPQQAFSYADFWQAVHPEDRECVRATLNHAIADHVDYDLEYQTRWPDGSIHWVLVRGQASYTSEGKPQRMVGVSLDITSRKQAERELARLHDEAVKASRAKDDFLAALSHELRTPLNPILLLASDAANDAELPLRARESFEIIRKNVELEARLIDDLLDLTSIVRGKLMVKKQSVSVHDILVEGAEAMSTDFEAKNIALELKLEAPKELVNADPVRLLQVFINLLKNAVKFTPQRGRVIVETRLSEQNKIEIRLSDTGIGMTPLELTRAFGAFEQGDHAATAGSHRFGGLGLGLAIARQLVELHAGTICAQSEGRDKGSTFIVDLPLAEASAAQEKKGAAQTAALEMKKAGLRVLLVEDHVPTRNALSQLLSRRNFRVTCAGSLAEGRECSERDGFDLVISDIGLPDGDGTELMIELREVFGLKGIALTGYGMEQDIARCQAAGFVSHLTKPVRVEALDAALAKISQRL